MPATTQDAFPRSAYDRAGDIAEGVNLMYALVIRLMIGGVTCLSVLGAAAG